MAARINIDKQAAKDWDIYFNNFIAEVSADKNETEAEQKERIKRLESDFEEWKKYYFPKYCYAPAAPFHIEASKRVLNNPEWVDSRVWARELAKDVVTMMETIYQAETGIKSNIILISNSWDKAADLLEPYRLILEKNERIINDYGIQQLPGSWAYGDFITTQGVSFLAVGAGQSPRGSRKEEVRPDKVIISDIDTDQDVKNTEIIDDRFKWYEKAVYPMRSVSKPYQVVWLGNLIAKDCCVARAMKTADYVDIQNLEDEDGNSTWPGKNSIENINRIKSKISTAAYQAEYMNNPVTEGSIFKEMRWGTIPDLRKFRFLIAYGDPAPSNTVKKKSKKASYKAVFLMGIYEGKLYVITGFLDRVHNDEFINWFYLIGKYVSDKTQVNNYMENNKLQDPFFQQVFKPTLNRLKKLYNKILSIVPDGRDKPDKAVRIEGNLEPLNRDGYLILNIAEKDNPHMQRLEEQFKMFDMQLSYPADGPDCIEGGYWIANDKMSQIGIDSMVVGERQNNSKRI